MCTSTKSFLAFSRLYYYSTSCSLRGCDTIATFVTINQTTVPIAFNLNRRVMVLTHSPDSRPRLSRRRSWWDTAPNFPDNGCIVASEWLVWRWDPGRLDRCRDAGVPTYMTPSWLVRDPVYRNASSQDKDACYKKLVSGIYAEFVGGRHGLYSTWGLLPRRPGPQLYYFNNLQSIYHSNKLFTNSLTENSYL